LQNWVGRELVYPTNVLHMAPECGNQGHPATFPVRLPEFFIRLLSKPGDRVLDPFLGSGTTAVAAQRLGREALGCEVSTDYVKLACERILRETQAMAVVRELAAPLPHAGAPTSPVEGRRRTLAAVILRNGLIGVRLCSQGDTWLVEPSYRAPKDILDEVRRRAA
jgi:hypothetical protein